MPASKQGCAQTDRRLLERASSGSRKATAKGGALDGVPRLPRGGGPARLGVGGLVLFSAKDGASGAELWRSDGTTPGSFLLKDIVPGPASSNPSSLTKVGDTVFMTVTTPAGPELWKTDGSQAGTLFVKAVANVQGMTDVNGVLFFTADDPLTGHELWRSD